MSTMTKVFVVLVAVLAIALSCFSIASAARWTNLKTTVENYQRLYQAELVHRMNAESAMALAVAQKDQALQAKQRELDQAQSRIREFNEDLAQLRIQLASEENQRVAAEAGRKKLEEILDVQMAELTATQKRNQELLDENMDLQVRNQRMAGRILELTSESTIQKDELRNLQEKLYAAEQALEEQQAVAARRAPAEEATAAVAPVQPPVAGPIQGEIVEVQGRYVSINVGETSGVVEGMPFMVYRGGTYVGDLMVENVRPKEAGGKLTTVAPGQSVRRGDRVAYGLE